MDNFSVRQRIHVRAPGGGITQPQRGEQPTLETGTRLSLDDREQTLLPARVSVSPSIERGVAGHAHSAPLGNAISAGRRGPRGGELPRNGDVPGITSAPGPTRTRKTEVRAAKPKRPPGTASLHREQYQLGEGGSVRGSCPMITSNQG